MGSLPDSSGTLKYKLLVRRITCPSTLSTAAFVWNLTLKVPRSIIWMVTFMHNVSASIGYILLM
jgi:hypothetical protein